MDCEIKILKIAPGPRARWVSCRSIIDVSSISLITHNFYCRLSQSILIRTVPHVLLSYMVYSRCKHQIWRSRDLNLVRSSRITTGTSNKSLLISLDSTEYSSRFKSARMAKSRWKLETQIQLIIKTDKLERDTLRLVLTVGRQSSEFLCS